MTAGKGDDVRALIPKARRLVIKIGSRVLVSGTKGLDQDIINQLAGDISEAHSRGTDVVIVSSGAIMAGIRKLGWSLGLQTLPEKQAAAAVGQGRLMWIYEQAFSPFGKRVAQILLTHGDLAHRGRYLNARNTLMTLLKHRVIPIINENDSVAVDEIRLGDNDNLSASVVGLVGADLLIILTDVDGFYTKDPAADPDARLLSTIPVIDNAIRDSASLSHSLGGTGGMITKLEAASKAASLGAGVVIANGRREGILGQILKAGEVGTFVSPPAKTLQSRKHWIAHILKPQGRLIVDDGAAEALSKRNSSLLPSGIVKTVGNFQRGDMVTVVDAAERELARGLVNYAAFEIEKIKGLHTDQIAECLTCKDYDEVIHRDNLVLTAQS